MSKRNHRRRSSVRKGNILGKSLLIPAVVALVAVALVVGIILSAEGEATGAANLLPNPDVPRINLDETQAMLEQGQAILIDVRSRESFEKSHAAGALSIPEDEMGARLNELPRDQEIILYCTWSQEQQSARVAQNLMSRGFDNVSALLGGYAAWQRAGLPTEAGGP